MILIQLLKHQPFFVHSGNDLIESTTFWLIQPQNLLIIRKTKYMVGLTKYLVNSTKKCISINQNLFDLTKFSWISNKTVLFVHEKMFSACGIYMYVLNEKFSKFI